MKNNIYSNLIKLLEDPDYSVYNEVSKYLAGYGASIIPELEKSWGVSENPLAQDRIEEIVEQINFDTIKTKFDNWLNSPDHDIVEGAFLVAKSQFPDINLLEIKYFLEDVVRKIWLEIESKTTIIEKIKIVNYFLFTEYEFNANMDDSKNANNYFINKVIESRVGSPILLAIIYIWILNRLDVSVKGIDLPYNTLIAIVNESYYKYINPNCETVKLYINPFNKGEILNKRDIDLFLEKINYPKSEKFYEPCSNVEIIGALINELGFIYRKTNKSDKANLLILLKEMANEKIKAV